MQRLNHLDRILFGSNTILVFKYPLMKRRLMQLKSEILGDNPDMTAEELENKARAYLIMKPLIALNED